MKVCWTLVVNNLDKNKLADYWCLCLVVTVLLVNSDGASAADINSNYKSAGLDKYVYKHQASGSWPTLQKMIDDGTRLVTFVTAVDSSTTETSYLLDEWSYIFENSYDVTSSSQFSCTPDRPDSAKGNAVAAIQSGKLPFMNHFLYQTAILDIETPNASYVGTTNAPSGGTGNLGDTATKCTQEYGRQPSFILVDFFNEGPAIDTVDKLNNVTSPVGRKELSSSQTSGGSTYSNVFKGLVQMVNQAKSGTNPPSTADWIWVGGDWGSLLGGGISI